MPTPTPVPLASSRALGASNSLRWLLGAAVVLQSLGLVWMAYHGGSPIFACLFGALGVDALVAARVDFVASYMTVTASLVQWRAGPIYLVAVVFVVVALASMIKGGEPHSAWSLFAQATRFAVPSALALRLHGHDDHGRWSLRLLSLAACCVFLVHGYEALAHTAKFVDLVIGSFENLARIRLDQGSVETALTAIGVLDIAAGLLLWTRWRQPVLLYMAAWGGLTLASRSLAYGSFGWAESLLRVANAVAPLAAYVLVRSRGSEPCHES